MARKTEIHLLCDVCGKEGAETWLIGTPDTERAKVDLCPTCERPLRKAFIAGRKSGLVGPQGADILHTIIVDDYEPSAQAILDRSENDNWIAAQEKRQGNG